MRACKILLICAFLCGCARQTSIPTCELQKKMLMDSEIQRLERRDKKIGLLIFWAVYGFGLSYLAYNSK